MLTEKLTLKNGLEVLFVDSHGSNVSTAQIWFKAGSSLEEESNRGIAHFLEHMFFKGTPKYPSTMLAKTIESYGGEINAFTSFDYTCYYANGPVDETKKTVDVILDMVSNPLFSQEDLEPEREVVFEEYRRSIDNPSQFNFFKLQKHSFPKEYKSPILGNETTIKNFSLEQLKDFRTKHYNLENALFVVAGDLKNKEELIEHIESFNLPHGERSDFSEFKLEKRSSIDIHEKAVNQATLSFVIQAPEYTDDHSPTEDLAINTIAYGDISPLYKDLVADTSLASSVGGSTMFFANGGAHFMRISFPMENMQAVFKQTIKTLKAIFKNGITQDDIDRIRNQYIASKVYEKESIESFAFSLGHGFAQTGDVDCEQHFINQMKLISKSQVHKALLDIFAREIHFTLQVPEGSNSSVLKDLIDNFRVQIKNISSKERLKDAKFKTEVSNVDSEVKCIQLARGIKLIHRQNKMTPTFAFQCFIKGGLSHETTENNGIYHLLQNTITYGHKKIKYPELKSQLEKKSSYINGFSGRNAYGVTLHGLSEHTDFLFSNFMQIVLTPSFSNDYFKLEKELALRTLHLQKQDPVKKCIKEFNQLVFKNHPYSMSINGTEKTIKKIKRKDLIEVHQENIETQDLVFTYCGDSDLESVIEKITPYIKQINRGKKAKKQKNKISPQKGKSINIEFDREQTHIIIGKPSFKVGTTEDLYLKILTSFLSGQSSELFVEVRDRQGLCYSVQALQNTNLEAGYWGIYIGSGHDKKAQAIKAIKDILSKYQKNGFSQEDFDATKKMIHGQNLIAIQTNDDYAGYYSIPVLHNLGLDFPHEGQEKIKSLELAGFNQFLKEFLVDDWNIVEVGRS